MQRFLVLLILAAAVGFLVWQVMQAPVSPERAPVPPSVSTEHVDGAGLDLVSWNIANLGGSKDDTEIALMADVLRTFDLVAIQEVITSPPGAQAVARLVDALERRGSDWDYRLSDPTEGDGPERYAFLWKPSRVRLVGAPKLESSMRDLVDREPYLGRFEDRASGNQLLVVNFHAVPRSKTPANEVRLLDQLHDRYSEDHVVMLGDFNLDGRHEAFDGLRRNGYRAALVGQRTSIRMEVREDGHLANEYDNLFYETGPLRAEKVGIVDFTRFFDTLREARLLSDHVPVYMEVAWN
ncbi:MAG: endonuclease/exonuclease/phosphatase family protein [Bacteroidota bacterium]